MPIDFSKFQKKEKGTEIKITPVGKIAPGEKKVSVSKPKLKPKKTKICPTCDKRHKIFGEKDLNRKEIIQWFQDFVSENEKNLPLDWLRGVKLSFESVNEMRK